MNYVFLVVPMPDGAEFHDVTADTDDYVGYGVVPLAHYTCGNGTLAYVVLLSDALSFAVMGYSPYDVIERFVEKHFQIATYDIREN